MTFLKTKLKDAFIVEPDQLTDERGFFARSWCQREFEALGVNKKPVQSNISFNKKRGTLRGLHYQEDPFGEVKLVRCTMGGIYDVIIDLRPSSETYLQWISVELTEKNRRLLFVPEGFAHGFMTLRDNTEVFYQMSQYYMPEYARGVRWDDPLFELKWPMNISLISDKDARYPDFAPAEKTVSF
ncbi:MAG: dTDP-4-dehydrorhamnose 3,5-epimerase [Nitrospiraceae bacterium]|nr:dTDP-4-dehydrorhamnose 3,5-epimerase [Nitrospiraceae bacterium]